MKKVSLLILASLIAKASISQIKLTGTWTSTKDKKYTVTLTDSTWISKYENRIIGTDKLYLSRDTLLTVSNNGDSLRCEILSLTKKRLTLMNMKLGHLYMFRRK